MARRVALSFWMAVTFVCGNLVAAQLAPPTPLKDVPKTAHVTLGRSTVPLYGPWKFTVGDSPIDAKTGKPLWAEPEFDDSKWETVDLRPKSGAIDPISGFSGYVPGWTVKGHPGYWGYAWYRIHVSIEAPQDQSLALAGPSNVDDIFQVFADGALIGQFGKFTGSSPTAYYTQPMMFSLPFSAVSPSVSSGEAKTLLIAYRDFMLPSTLTAAADVGGFHNAPILGDTTTVTAGYTVSWLELVQSYALGAALAFTFALMALLAFTLILFDRSDKAYHWIGWLFLLEAASYALLRTSTWTQFVSITTGQIVNDGLMTALIYTGWVIVWWVWFGRQRPSWTPLVAAGLGLLFFTSIVIGQEMLVGFVPHRIASAFLSASVVVRLLFLALQIAIVSRGIRRQGLEGWLVLPAVLLWSISSFSAELSVLNVTHRWTLFGLGIRLGNVSDLLLVLVIGVLLLRRLLTSIRAQRQMALDVKQAQEVQQVILPEPRLALPGLTVESEYRPAREVGGDFFQIIPHTTDGSLLIVAGDVTGKGLKAGMLVALLVGAIRTGAETSDEPEFILTTLNRRLMGRGDAQATCLALRIAANGEVALANAGHMAPYLNGEPIAMEGALPLGMMENVEFSLMHFQLKPDDKLVLMSDGIAEATDAEGHLFGFERVLELLHSAKSAAEIAKAAQSFGQDDDISVISVTRTLVTEPALA